MKRTRAGAGLAIILAALTAAACGSRGMRTVQQVAVAPPGPDAAVVVFLRPAMTGELHSTSVFDLRPDGPRFVAIMRSQTRFAYRTTPGRTRFMLVTTGGYDDYLDAELAPGKTYYVTVNYGMVRGQAGYSLKPVRLADLDGDQFKSDMASCAWVENTEQSEAWGRNHLRELPRRQAKTLPGWEAQRNRVTLGPNDGR